MAAWLPLRVGKEAVAASVQSRALAPVGLLRFSIMQRHRPGLVLGYAPFIAAEVPPSVRRLVAEIDELAHQQFRQSLVVQYAALAMPKEQTLSNQNRAAREKLRRVFGVQADFFSFVQDYFPDETRHFSSQQSPIDWENKLLELIGAADVITTLAKFEQDRGQSRVADRVVRPRTAQAQSRKIWILVPSLLLAAGAVGVLSFGKSQDWWRPKPRQASSPAIGSAVVASLPRTKLVTNVQRVLHVPVVQTNWFFPRPVLLARIEKELRAKRRLALIGMGGLGKTQTAAKLATDLSLQAEFPVVLWLSGENPETFQRGLVELYPALLRGGRVPKLPEEDLPGQRRVVLDYLRQTDEYLLVCDNVEDPQGLRAVWPQPLPGRVLMTSPRREVETLGMELFQIELLDTRESVAFLEMRHHAPSIDEKAAQTELARDLGGLPLALAQAAAFLRAHGSRYVDYLREYRRRHTELLDQSLPSDYPRSVSTTWQVSFDLIQREHPAAAELLQVCAWLDGDGIPEEVFAQPSKCLPKSLHDALRPENALALDQVLGPLLDYGFVQRNAQERRFSIHQLVQMVIKHALPGKERSSNLHHALHQVETAFPSPEFANWPKCRRLVPQVQALATELKDEGLPDPAAGVLFSHAGRFLYTQAQFVEAESLYRQMLAIMGRWIPTEAPALINGRGDLATVLRIVGKLDEAELLQRQLLASAEKMLPPDSTHLATALNNLALVLQSQGKLAEAETLDRRALAIRQKSLPPEHPHLTWSLNALSSVLSDQHKQLEAEPLLRRALEIDKKNLGPEDPGLARNLNALAMNLYEQGNLIEAEPLFRRSLAVREQAFGPEHPDVAESLGGLGLLLEAQGKLSDAESALRRSLAIMTKTMPAGHKFIDTARRNLDSFLRRNQIIR